MIIDAYFRELQAATNEPGRAPPPTEEGIRIHAWLSDRLAALDRTRSGLWPRLVRFLRAMFALAKSG